MRFRPIPWFVLAATILAACDSDDDEPVDKRPRGFALCKSLDPTLCVAGSSTWPPDDEMRLAIAWKIACEQSSWPACVSLGVFYEEGRVVLINRPHAAVHFTNACNGGDREGCFRLSRLYERGDLGTGPLPARAKEYREKACAMGDLRGCLDGGAMAIASVLVADPDGGVRRQWYHPELYDLMKIAGRAGNLDARKCNADDGRACNDLGWAFQSGTQGLVKNEASGVPFYRRACELKYARGCDNLGWVYQKGIGVARDDKRAFEAYEKACDGGDANGCNNLGWLHRNGLGTKQDEVLAAPLFEKACDADNKFGCANLAWLFLHGLGVAVDRTKAESLYRRACALGHRDACSTAKRMAR